MSVRMKAIIFALAMFAVALAHIFDIIDSRTAAFLIPALAALYAVQAGRGRCRSLRGAAR